MPSFLSMLPEAKAEGSRRIHVSEYIALKKGMSIDFRKYLFS